MNFHDERDNLRQFGLDRLLGPCALSAQVREVDVATEMLPPEAEQVSDDRTVPGRRDSGADSPPSWSLRAGPAIRFHYVRGRQSRTGVRG